MVKADLDATPHMERCGRQFKLAMQEYPPMSEPPLVYC